MYNSLDFSGAGAWFVQDPGGWSMMDWGGALAMLEVGTAC